MEQEENRFQYLLDRYINNSCSAAELEEFWQLAAALDLSEELHAILWPLWKEEERNSLPVDYTKALYGTIISRAESWEQQDNVRRLRKKRQRSSFLVGAMVLLTGMAGVWYFSHLPTQVTPEMTAQTKEHILPGNNRAILTLNNGQVIDLDKAVNGKLAEEGSTVIYKNGDGKLDYTGNTSNGKPGINKIETPKGGQFQVALPDGTKVWLNAGSSLTYPTAFSGTERKVTLTGEAYFEIAPQSRMPFYVSVSGMDVLVLGTSFNIKAYADEAGIYTTLVEGAVSLKEQKSNSRILLKPGEQAFCSVQGSLTKKTVDVESITGWKNGYFSFDANLASITRDIARWYDVSFVFNGNVEQKMFSGTISRYTQIEEVLAMLETTKSVRFRIEGRKIIAEPWK